MQFTQSPAAWKGLIHSRERYIGIMEPECLGCRQRDERIAQLERQLAELAARLRDLEARLGQNASNSSIPPSANPPRRRRRSANNRPAQPGGQPGHTAHLRQRLPADRLTEPVVHYRPTVCEACQHDLPTAPGAEDREPRWHQLVELPELPMQVTEHQAHGRNCPCCGHLTWGQIPPEVRADVCGPRLTAVMSLLSSSLHASKHGHRRVRRVGFPRADRLGHHQQSRSGNERGPGNR